MPNETPDPRPRCQRCGIEHEAPLRDGLCPPCDLEERDRQGPSYEIGAG